MCRETSDPTMKYIGIGGVHGPGNWSLQAIQWLEIFFLDELYVILSFKLFLVSIWTIFKQNHMNSMGFLWNDFSLLGWLQA
jgi:hypothetical protein